MTPQQSEARKWLNLCAIIGALVVGFYLITPSSKPQHGFVYNGETYTTDDTSHGNEQLSIERKQQSREALDGCHVELHWHRFSVTPNYVCDK